MLKLFYVFFDFFVVCLGVLIFVNRLLFREMIELTSLLKNKIITNDSRQAAAQPN